MMAVVLTINRLRQRILGLIIMKERAQAIDAGLEIIGQIGTGTSIELRWRAGKQ